MAAGDPLTDRHGKCIVVTKGIADDGTLEDGSLSFFGRLIHSHRCLLCSGSADVFYNQRPPVVCCRPHCCC